MIARNAMAGIASSAWTALVGLAVVPLYLRILGIEAYGLLAFLTAVQAILQLLDMGLSAAVSREIARRSAHHDAGWTADLVHTLACMYWVLTPFIVAGLFFLAPALAEHWIKPEHLERSTVETAIKVMAIGAGARLPIGLYQGVLIGRQQLLTMSLVTTTVVSASALGSVLLIYLYSSSVLTLLAWQAFVTVVQVLAIRHFARRALSNRGARFALETLPRIWRFSASLALVGVMGAALTQVDRVLLGRLLSLSSYGGYALATLVAGSIYVVVLPVFNALYPRLVVLVEGGDEAALERTYRLATCVMASIVFPVAGLLSVCAEDLVVIWTGDTALALTTAPLIRLLATGCAVHGLMHVQHALQLAHGATHIPLKINGFLVCVQIPLLIELATRYGATGAAAAWLLLHLAYCALGSWLTYRQFFVGRGTRWLAVDAGVPVAIAMAGALTTAGLAAVLPASLSARLACGITVLCISIAACLLACPSIRGMMRSWLKTRLSDPVAGVVGQG